MVTGLGLIKTPALFTFYIWLTCYYIGMNLCKMPSPPCLAIYMAIRYSVTVSIGEETIGTLRGMLWENNESILHWLLK